MTDVASRELRNNTRALLDRVNAGESLTITVDGRAVAVLQRAKRRSCWAPRAEFMQDLATSQADHRLSDELRHLAPETTDDLPSW